MADDQDQDTERVQIRDRFQLLRADLAEVSDQEWADERDDEMRVVREWAAARRRRVA
ncbi:hypothetical protein [Micromonospora sp. DT229]|uniref:hypothetical protein n=1 Tax=Micromonospora sp. DT229 TaxID=3393430 RepID=UPI003CF0A7FA